MENGVVHLVNRSDPIRFSHRICCLHRSGASARRLVRPVPIDELNKGDGNSVGFVFRLTRYIRRAAPHIVHTRTWGGMDGILAAKLARVPVVVHGEHGFHPEDPLGRDPKKRWVRRALSPLVNNYVTVSRDLQRLMQQDVKIRKPILTIHNGVDANRFHPGAKVEGLTDEQGLADRFVVGAVGRLDPIKRYDLLIKAFCALEPHRFNGVLMIVGDGPMRDELEALKRRLDPDNRVRVLGERHDLPVLYRVMDLFVQPSANEGISNTILEAMATALPVIATGVGGNPELIRTGVNGLLIPPDSTRDIEKALWAYINDSELREQHGKMGRRIAEREFSIDQMVRSYEYLYNRLMKKA